jgi:hypothetical protein
LIIKDSWIENQGIPFFVLEKGVFLGDNTRFKTVILQENIDFIPNLQINKKYINLVFN